jgi:nucleoside-diphosphate-sugar epimerase
MKITVFGANGPAGRLLTNQALAEGHEVTAFTRRPDDFPHEHERLLVLGGDVYDAASVESAVVGRDAVLSSLGVPYGRNKPISVYSEGSRHILAAMHAHGVRRVVCVSSSATENSGPHGGFFFEKVLTPFFTNVMGRTLYDDMRRMESQVMASDIDWTIVRPNGLFSTDGITKYEMAETYVGGKFTSRADLADSMLRVLDDDKYVCRIAAVATVSVKPSLINMIWNEGIKKK